jgi:cobalt-zinc-cadmium efflux system outer membrane protein
MPLCFFAPARRVAVGVALCAALGVAHAASSPPPAELTTLTAAVRAAWERHPAADATEHTLAAARARAQAAGRPLYNPDLEVEVEDEGEDRTSTAGLAWTLDWSGKRRARADAGLAELTLAEAEAAQRRSTFALQWLQAWAARLAAIERVRLGERRLVLVERFADLAERQLAAGDISTLERDLALLARDEAQAEQATLLSEAASAEESLQAVGASPADASLTVPSAPPPAWDPSMGVGLRHIPEARVAAATAASASRRISIAERDRRPDPTISVRAGRVDFGPASDNVLGVALSVPLFVRNTYRAEVVAARADAGAAEAEHRRVEIELQARAERTARTYDAVRAAWEQWSKSAGTDVDKRADLLERLWRAGEISTADYLIQLKQSLDTALAGADLHGRLWRSYIDALYATGQLDAWVGFDAPNVKDTP